jgi:hypothetical protein
MGERGTSSQVFVICRRHGRLEVEEERKGELLPRGDGEGKK